MTPEGGRIAHSHRVESRDSGGELPNRSPGAQYHGGAWGGTALSLTLVAAGALALFGGMLIRGQVLFWGTPLLQFVPWREKALEMILRGVPPLWNPALGMGTPLLANYQSALLYPPTWIQMLVGVPWGQGLLVAAHVIWAGVGMALLARRLGLSPLGMSVAALAFCLSGYSIARAGFLSINATLSWLPWLVLACERMLDGLAENGRPRGRWGPILALGLLFGLQWLAGHAQTAWYSLVLVCSWAAWRATRPGCRFFGRAAIGLIVAGGIGLALASAQLLPTGEYLLSSYRASRVDTDLAFLYSFSPVRIFGLLMPEVMGSPTRGSYHGYGNFWEDAIYIGVLPLLLAASAGYRALRRKGEYARLGAFLLLAAAIGFTLALGVNTPLFPWLFEHVPTFSLFQAPTRWSLLAVFCLSLLGGIGAHQWRPPRDRTLYWVRLGTAGAGAMVATSLLALPALEGGASLLMRPFIRAGSMLTVAGILALVFDRIRSAWPLSWPWIVGTFVMLDLALAASGLNPAASPDLYRGRSRLVEQVDVDHRLYMSPDLEYALKFDTFFRFDTFSPGLEWGRVRDLGIPNVTSLDGIPSANNFDPIRPDRYALWMAGLESKDGRDLERLLALMDVGHYAAEGGAALDVKYVPVRGAARVRFVPHALVEAGAEGAFRRVMGPEFDPDRQVVLETEPDPRALVEGGQANELELRDAGPLRVEVRAASDLGGWLVLSDTWYPGWEVALDGARVPMYRADFLFRALYVPPGRHHVEFRYRPRLQIAGALISIAAWVALGGALWRLRRD